MKNAPRTSNGLTEIAVKAAKPAKNPYKMADSAGLFLLIKPNGSKYWRFKYRFAGAEKNLAFGVYPEVSLKEARQKRDDARFAIRNGGDPAESKKEQKRQQILQAANTFEAVAREWFEKAKDKWTEHHADRVIGSLEKDIFPHIGTRPIEQITSPEMLAVLRKVEKRDALDVVQRLRQRCSAVFKYAKLTHRASQNPVSDLEGALKTRKKTHRLALAANDLPVFLRKLANYEGDFKTRFAMQLLILTMLRAKEMRGARWEEIDFTKKEWRIPASRMKMRDEHIVPLSDQAIALLKQLQPLTGGRDLLFPGVNPAKPISENTLIYAMYRMGYHGKATVHGFRATASTVLNESSKFAPDVIERQLAHAERNEVRAAYNRSQYLPERKKMMQWWGDYLAKAAKA